MFARVIGVFKLDVDTFEEIEHDQSATGQAAIVVAIVALLGAIGSGLAAVFSDQSFFTNFLTTLIWTFIGWVLWSAVTYLVGTSLFQGQADLGEMLRVIGFAYAPQALGIIPCLGTIVGIIWTLIAGFIAIRQGLDLDNTKAFLTIVIGLVVYIAGFCVLGLFVGGLGAGIGALSG
jgi:hypothetical protein